MLCTDISEVPSGPPAESGPFGPSTPNPSAGPRKCGGSSSSSSSLAEPINESVKKRETEKEIKLVVVGKSLNKLLNNAHGKRAAGREEVRQPKSHFKYNCNK